MLASNAMAEEPRDRSRLRPARLVAPVLLVLCATKIVLLTVLAVNSIYAPDEYQQAGASMHIAEGFYRGFQPIKTVLYAYYYQLAHQVTTNAVDLMRVARLQGLVLAVGMVVLVFATARRYGARRAEALFPVFVLLSFSTFMERAFRVRADTVAVFFALAGLAVAVGGRRDREEWLAGRWRPLAVGLLVGGAFLSTQKAAYHALAFGLGYLAVGLTHRWKRVKSSQHRLRGLLSGLSPAAWFSAGWALSLLGYALYFGGFGFARVLRAVFLAPREVALQGDEAYWNLQLFVLQTLSRNQLAYGLCFAGLVVGLSRWRRLEPWKVLGLIVALVLTGLVLVHNQPWPYVFVLLLPFLAAWSLEAVGWLTPDNPRHSVLLLALALLLALSFPRNLSYLDYDNVEQNRVVARAEALLGPDDRYADGVGMIPTRRRAGERWWWDAGTQEEIHRAARKGEFTALDETFGDQPKLWILNYRVQALYPLIGTTLEKSYVAVEPNILLVGTHLQSGPEQEFFAVWPGSYRLYDSQGHALEGKLTINGSRVEGEVRLETARYVLRLEDGEALWLPAAVDLTGPLPARDSAASLFGGVYD